MKIGNTSLSIAVKDPEGEEVYTKNNLTIADIALTFTDISLTFTDTRLTFADTH